MLNYEVAPGLLHGIKMGRSEPPISHLMFVDDCLFFCRANMDECSRLKELLNYYKQVSGQTINYKSGIFFSRNMSEGNREAISNILRVSNPLNTGRYLGLPSLIGRKKREVFRFLSERLWKKVQSWKVRAFRRQGMKQ